MYLRIFRLLKFTLLGFFILGGTLTFVANLWVALAASGRFLEQPAQVPEGAVAIVLGVSEYRRLDGQPTLTYHPRLDAGTALAKSGRLHAIVVSGTPEQADAMRDELLRRGVSIPIVRDPHGLRTLDSVARAAARHPDRPLVFVSQGWHVDRALWQAERIGRPSLGYAAAEGDNFRARYLAPARDVLAKTKALLDWLVGFPLTTDVPPGSGDR